jgi:hypothetical protein
MTARLPIALLALTLAFGCSKKKPQVDPNEARQKLLPFILSSVPEIPNKLETKFGDKVRLLGYAVEPAGPVKSGQKVKMTFYWQTSGKVEGAYKLFTHILDGSGEKLSQIERNAPLRPSKKDKNTGLPLSMWEAGKVYVDQQTFHVPKAKTDTIQIVAGLYNKQGRMPVTVGAKDSSDRATVASLSVQSGGEGKSKSPKLPSISVDRLEASDKITIDGKLDEEVWKNASVLSFTDPKTGSAPKDSPVTGSAKLLWNDTNLYVAFEVQEASILGGFPKTAKDPHLWTKDAVELMIDPDGDGDNLDYYEIQIGPQNLVFDSRFDKYNEPKTEPDGPFGHQDWSAKLKSAVVLNGTIDKPEDTDKGYTVEAQIPWKSFDKAKKAPPALGDTWRMNFYAMKENSGVAWSPIAGQGNFHKASRFGKVRFTAKGWTPPTDATTDGGAPAPSASAAATPGASGAPAMRPASPKSMGSSIKLPTARPVGSAP